MVLKPLVTQRETPCLRYPSHLWVAILGGVGPDKITYLSLLSISTWLIPFVLICGIVVLLVFYYFSERIVLYVLVISVCLWEEVSSGASYATTLNH